MDAHDEMVEAVARGLFIDFGGNPAALWDDGVERAWKRGWREQALIALSVPALAEVIARDAKVRAEVDETRARCEREQLGHDGTMWEAADLGVAIAALYPEAGK